MKPLSKFSLKKSLQTSLPTFLRKTSLILASALTLTACSNLSLPSFSGGGNSGPTVDRSAPVPVALLVPLSKGGEVSVIASDMVNAAKLALSDMPDIDISMKVYDTAGDEATSIARANEAVADGAKIILGPLYADNALAVGNVVAAQNIPVMSFSNTSTVAGGNVYLLGPTPDSVAKRVVGFAAGRGIDRIGVIYPNNIRGETSRDAVAREAAAAGATVVLASSYSDTDIDAFLAQTAAAAAALQSAGAEGVVLTASPATSLAPAAQQLDAAGADGSKMKKLGLTQWNQPYSTLSNPNLRGGWFGILDPAITEQFRNRYGASYGKTPHHLAALAYDGMAAVGALLDNNSRTPFSTAKITASSGFAGANGVFRFRSNGLNDRSYAIMEVGNGSAFLVDPAPRSFGGALN